MEALGYEETYGCVGGGVESRRGSLRRGETNSRAQAQEWEPQRERSLSIGCGTHADEFGPAMSFPLPSPMTLSRGISGSVLLRQTSESVVSTAFGVIRRRLEATHCISSLLSSVDLVDLARQCEVWVYQPGELLMVEGCPGNFMLIVDEGSASVYKQPGKSSEAKGDGRLASPHGEFVSTRGAGEIIGEVSILASCARTATVVANKKLSAVCVPRHVVLALCERNQHLANTLMEISAWRAVHLIANGPGKQFEGNSALGLYSAPTVSLALGALVAVCMLVRSVRKA
mmetsp:Transcript_46780/g.113959  ORF Transcript_46780/g.113959 Transcript_46780/m.113959 type:complete len:286 (-) Transcript_46780:107-964(-)